MFGSLTQVVATSGCMDDLIHHIVINYWGFFVFLMNFNWILSDPGPNFPLHTWSIFICSLFDIYPLNIPLGS